MCTFPNNWLCTYEQSNKPRNNRKDLLMALVLWRFELTWVQHEASKTAPSSTFCNLLLFSHKTRDPVSRWSCWHSPLGSGRSSSFLDQFIPLGVSGRGIQLHIKAGYIPGLVTSSIWGSAALLKGTLVLPLWPAAFLAWTEDPLRLQTATTRVMSDGPLTRFTRVPHECHARIIMCGYKLPPFQNKRYIFFLVGRLNMHMFTLFRCPGTSKRCNFL